MNDQHQYLWNQIRQMRDDAHAAIILYSRRLETLQRWDGRLRFYVAVLTCGSVATIALQFSPAMNLVSFAAAMFGIYQQTWAGPERMQRLTRAVAELERFKAECDEVHTDVTFHGGTSETLKALQRRRAAITDGLAELKVGVPSESEVEDAYHHLARLKRSA